MFSGKRSRGAIGRKITLAIVISIFVITFIGIGLTYFFGSNLLMNMLGGEYSQIAKTLGAYMVRLLTDEIEDAKSYATRPLWVDAVEEVNLKYSKMSGKDIENYMADMDKRWSTAEKGSLFLIEYLQNRISLNMRDTAQSRSAVAEFFMTDKYGGLAASSDMTSDFYQADEEWWKEAYNNGKGAVFVGDMEFDDSSRRWAIPIAIPIFDRNKEVIGILKYGISIERLLGGLADFRIGQTGRAILVDEKGKIIFHRGIGTMKEYIPVDNGFAASFSPSKPYKIITAKAFHDKRVFIAFARVDPRYLSNRNIGWFILVAEEWLEVSGPLNRFITIIIMITVIMLIFAILTGHILGGLIARPIHELHVATEHVIAGDWDYAIKINTGDEIEQLADAFSQMIADIKNKQKELKDFSRGLEINVGERTKELSAAQEAALNMLEDLRKTKEDLERTNKELLKLDQLKSDFISTVSHELRTPLSIIKESISLILDKIPGDVNEKQARILSISKYNMDRLARIINNLLDVSKIEAGKVELRMDLINIADVIKETAASFEGVIKDKGLELRLDVDKATGSVYADSDKITQVLMNLIGNAVKFTSSGSINISCKDEDDAILCSVADTGDGISKNDLPKVFGKFQQFGRLAGAGDKGTGLGLSIAKGIIDMHNGAIWVESEIGKGARFTFKLHKYTSQSLFREYVARAVSKAASEDARLSIIAINAGIAGADETNVLKKKFHDIMHENAILIKNSLSRQGDDVVNSDREMIVILVNCDKESSAKIRHRLEEIINQHLAEQKMDGIIKISYGYATYPDDGLSAPELIDKAKQEALWLREKY
ncbi:MAG: ATP-binding protein [Candidatus Omnitrophota bacterium]|nr:ATP-binding protein [Candidatus Omnitrophota bacterium]